MSKKKLELEKLKLEINELKKPFYRKVQVWFSLLGLILAIVGVFVQGTISKYEKVKAEDEMRQALAIKSKAEKDTNSLRDEKENLEKFIASLQANADNLRNSNTELISITKSKNPSTKDEKIITKAKNANYTMTVWAYRISQTIVDEVRSYLVKEGYSLSFGGLLNVKKRPSWMSTESVVFYYHNESIKIAENIRDQIVQLTGMNMTVERGAGLGVTPGQEPWTFYIHLVN